MNWSTSSEEIRHLADHFDTSRTFDSLVGDDGVGADDLLESVGHVLVDGVSELTERLDQQLQVVVLKDAGGLRKLLGQGGDGAQQVAGHRSGPLPGRR